jgi:hypothetical protein
MTKTCTDPLTIAVWSSMAGHFLDTETRHDLPYTALCCVEAGLSAAQARQVWQFEVSPAVGSNLFSVAGEWAGWDHDWLVERIERMRVSWWNRPGPWRWLRTPLVLQSDQWLAIERCMRFLQAMPCEMTRKRVARDLAWLTRHLVDFCPKDLSTLEAEERELLRQLYPAPFNSLLESSLARSERAQAAQRVQRALSASAP